MSRLAKRHGDLDVYKAAFTLGMEIFRLSKGFPKVEDYALTDQVRRSSRAVAVNVAEGWRKRRYPRSFRSTLTNAEAEAAETQSWLQFATECEYLDREVARDLYRRYDRVIAQLVTMIRKASDYAIKDA